MTGGDDETIVERWKWLAEQEPNSRRRSQLAGLALVFATAADCREEWELGLKGCNVKECTIMNDWIAAGRAEGRVEERAASLVAILEEKFGAVPEDLASAIRACTDLAKLRQLIGIAIRADTLDAFRAAAAL